LQFGVPVIFFQILIQILEKFLGFMDLKNAGTRVADPDPQPWQAPL